MKFHYVSIDEADSQCIDDVPFYLKEWDELRLVDVSSLVERE